MNDETAIAMTVRRNRPGLQRQRSQLGWERTAWGYVAIGVVLAFRHPQAGLHAGGLMLSLTAFALAAMLFRMRHQRLRQRPAQVYGARWAIQLTGVATALFALACAIALTY